MGMGGGGVCRFTHYSGQDPARCPYDPTLPPAQQLQASFASSLSHLRCALAGPPPVCLLLAAHACRWGGVLRAEE